MKNALVTLTLLISALVPFENAEAKCYDGDPEEYRTTCPPKQKLSPDSLKQQLYGKTFCEVGSNGSAGFSITQEGIVGFFASNIGAPNPFTYFAVIDGYSDSSNPMKEFKIQEFEKSTLKPLANVTQYFFHQKSKIIYSEMVVFSEVACGHRGEE